MAILLGELEGSAEFTPAFGNSERWVAKAGGQGDDFLNALHGGAIELFVAQGKISFWSVIEGGMEREGLGQTGSKIIRPTPGKCLLVSHNLHPFSITLRLSFEMKHHSY
jgi:hypothetical protein